MEDLVGEIGKGFLRVIGYLLGEIFFGTICYWVGWPICKVLTLGKYPSKTNVVYLEHSDGKGFWCAATGLIFLVGFSIALLGFFE